MAVVAVVADGGFWLIKANNDIFERIYFELCSI